MSEKNQKVEPSGTNVETVKSKDFKSVASPTKSVKNKSLPSTRLASKFSTASKVRSASYGTARPVSASVQKRVVKTTTGSKQEAANSTPEKSQGKKACSTPTSDEVTLSDLTLDASCISKRPGELDDTVTSAPIMKIGPGSRSQFPSLRKKNNNMDAPKLKSARKPGTTSVSNSVLKSGIKTIREAMMQEYSDPDEVTDEMMDRMYNRYIQAKYIEMKSKEAMEKAEEDAKRQILEAFFATEELRIEVEKREQALMVKSCLESMRKSYKFLEGKLAPLLEKMCPADERLEAMASSMEKVKHNLVVQGIDFVDQSQAASHMEKLSVMLLQFIEDAKSFMSVIEDEEVNLEGVNEDTIKLHNDYTRLVGLVGECNKVIKKCEILALQEMSLKISLCQLEKSST